MRLAIILLAVSLASAQNAKPKLPGEDWVSLFNGKDLSGWVKIGNRRALADSLGITINALSIRACRIRDKLEACVKECANVK